jgi:aryl-alcohol dehydrogenase-like predicted oxidoreductase
MKANLKIKKLSLGTAQLGMDYGVANLSGQPTIQVAQAIIDIARESNIKSIDTAKSYGSSEKTLGQVGVSEFHITTKLVHVPENTIKMESLIRSQVEESLNLLKVSKLEGILIHNSSLLYGKHGAELVKILSKLRFEGITRKIGVSIYEPGELKNISTLTELNVVQAPFNVLDRRMEETGWLTWLTDNNIEIEARSIFLQGLLLLERKNVPSKFEEWSDIWDKWDIFVKDSKLSRLALCLNFALNHPQIDRVIVGVETTQQLKEIINVSTSRYSLIDNFSFSGRVEPDLINPFNWSKL